MTGDRAPNVSIVVALLDQQGTIEELVRRTCAALEAHGRSFEIILVDDGSHDQTVAITRRLEDADARLRVFELTRNFGQASALACGIFAARGAVVVQMDGDLQNPPEEIPKLLDAVDAGAGVATGRRAQRYERFGRWLGSRIVHRLARRLTGAEIEDFGGNFKAYRRDVVETMRGLWARGKPLFPLAVWLGFPVSEVTVRHDPPWQGESRYRLGTLLRINVDLITGFSTAPLAVLGLTGAGCLALGALAVAIISLQHRPSWLAAATAFTLLIIGAVFFAAGVLGQYLGRVYKQAVGGEPAFVVRTGPRRDAAPAAARDGTS